MFMLHLLSSFCNIIWPCENIVIDLGVCVRVFGGVWCVVGGGCMYAVAIDLITSQSWHIWHIASNCIIIYKLYEDAGGGRAGGRARGWEIFYFIFVFHFEKLNLELRNKD